MLVRCDLTAITAVCKICRCRWCGVSSGCRGAVRPCLVGLRPAACKGNVFRAGGHSHMATKPGMGVYGGPQHDAARRTILAVPHGAVRRRGRERAMLFVDTSVLRLNPVGGSPCLGRRVRCGAGCKFCWDQPAGIWTYPIPLPRMIDSHSLFPLLASNRSLK
jgi:hypothetical protein